MDKSKIIDDSVFFKLVEKLKNSQQLNKFEEEQFNDYFISIIKKDILRLLKYIDKYDGGNFPIDELASDFYFEQKEQILNKLNNMDNFKAYLMKSVRNWLVQKNKALSKEKRRNIDLESIDIIKRGTNNQSGNFKSSPMVESIVSINDPEVFQLILKIADDFDKFLYENFSNRDKEIFIRHKLLKNASKVIAEEYDISVSNVDTVASRVNRQCVRFFNSINLNYKEEMENLLSNVEDKNNFFESFIDKLFYILKDKYLQLYATEDDRTSNNRGQNDE